MDTSQAIESRTQEIGRTLYDRFSHDSPSWTEQQQDKLMVLLEQDHILRTRLLRYVDVLAGLPPDPWGARTASLFREYFRADFSHLPWLLRGAIAKVRNPLFPPPLLKWGVDRAMHFMASRFILEPGPDKIDESIRRFQQLGRYPSFDLLGEDILSDEEADAYKNGYLRLIERLGKHTRGVHNRTPGGEPALEVSLKLSSLVPESLFVPADPEGTLKRVRPALEDIYSAARQHGVGVTVDAEQYAFRELVWFILQQVLAPGERFGDWPDAGMVVQAYLKDAADHAQEVAAFSRKRTNPLRVRLVKGAYWDYEVIVAEGHCWPAPVHRSKGATDLCFEEIVRLFLDKDLPVKLAVGSHNIRTHAYPEAVREVMGLPAALVEHQTLHRTLEPLSAAIPQMGWPAREYVPSGEPMPGMAYLVRRILENTSQAGFLARARLHEDPASLLQAPVEGPEDKSYKRVPDPSGFANASPIRLFEKDERARFRAALEHTRSKWGATYPLRLGDQTVETARKVPSVSPSYPDVSNPVGWVHVAGPEEVAMAIRMANDAAPDWAAVPPAKRAALGLDAARMLQSRREEIAAWVVHEGGRTWSEALADVDEAVDSFNWNARQLLRLAPEIEGLYKPRGVVAVIAPWNFPTALPAGMIAGALMAGNTVIFKSAGPTQIVGHKLVEALHDGGIPRRVLTHLPGSGNTVGAALTESPEVDMVAFTGSKGVGTQICQSAGKVQLKRGGIKRVVAEMGGKNAIVVFPDADIDEAVNGILASAFSHSGQKCSACSRVLTHADIYDRLVQRLVQAAGSLVVGPADDPSTFLNPVINAKAREGILKYGEIARREGHVLLDKLGDWSRDNGSNSLGPMIVEIGAAKAATSRMFQEEVFGPVLTLVKFNTEAEAIALHNGTMYALTSGIFSRSPGAIKRCIRAFQAGNVYVNRETVGARIGIEPFGGFQMSGTGPKAGSDDYLLAYMTRRDGYRNDGAGTATGHPASTPTVGPWDATPGPARLQRLQALGKLLSDRRPALEAAVGKWKGADAVAATAKLLDTLVAVLSHASQILEPQPTVALPGQTNYMLWDTSRGVGLVSVDEGSDPATVAGLIFGPLLAGNGVLVAVEPLVYDLAHALVTAAYDAGVPKDVLALAQAETLVNELAKGPIHFAAFDLSIERARELNLALSQVDEAGRQKWLKALIAASDGPRPGERGFLRQFVHPKAVAVRTLRHGADLELV